MAIMASGTACGRVRRSMTTTATESLKMVAIIETYTFALYRPSCYWHPYDVQLTPAKTRYPLTTSISQYHGFKLRVYRGHVFLEVDG